MMSIMFDWFSMQVNYIQAYTQTFAEIKDLYMKIPKGFQVKGGKSNKHLPKVNRNIYGQKQARRI